jgi:hypothetical protein
LQLQNSLQWTVILDSQTKGFILINKDNKIKFRLFWERNDQIEKCSLLRLDHFNNIQTESFSDLITSIYPEVNSSQHLIVGRENSNDSDFFPLSPDSPFFCFHDSSFSDLLNLFDFPANDELPSSIDLPVKYESLFDQNYQIAENPNINLNKKLF